MSYFDLTKMITPKIMIFVYWLGAVLITLIGLSTSLLPKIYPTNLSQIMVIFFGNIIWRIICEYLVVQFQIFENLKQINGNLQDLKSIQTPISNNNTIVNSNHKTETSYICSYCNSPIEKDALICPKCGKEDKIYKKLVQVRHIIK